MSQTISTHIYQADSPLSLSLKQPVSILMIFFLNLVLFSSSLVALPAKAANISSVPASRLLAADMVEDNQPIDLKNSKYADLFKELIEKHKFDNGALEKLFSGLRIDRKVLVLMDKQWEAKPYYQYWPRFITASVIRKGKKNIEKYQHLLDKIEKEIGVNRETIVAIWAIESRFGSNTGGFNLFRTLNTLFDAYPRRSDFFRKELLNFLLLCRANDIDPLSVKGSYAGAFGQAQFMPSSYNAYAIDFDGNGKINLISSMPDVFGSIASYLKTFGWVLSSPVYADIGNDLHSVKLIQIYNKGRKGRVDWRYVAETQEISLPRPPKNGQLSIVGLQLGPDQNSHMRYIAGYPNFHAITHYNHSHKYAMAVSELAKALRE